MFEASIEETAPVTVAFLQMTGPYEQIPEAFGRLYHWIGQSGIPHVGPPHGVYITPPDETPDAGPVWEVWAPIDPDTPESPPDPGGIGVKKVEPLTVAKTVHVGPYESLESPYHQLAEWIDAKGFASSGPTMELYLSDPDEVPPEQYVTEIRMPVAKR
ncbi:MAG: GyrI-like domain-containing protein [Coriobacteriales bacterium]|nr:GyrI-like domain-containing protein [Coriobacteriales bacterium]